MRKLCLSFCLLLWMTNYVASAQTPSVSGITQTPILNSGHDYIQSLNEIVDPSSGSLSIRIAAPSPRERGMNLPHYAFIYDTNGAPQYTISPYWTQVPGVGGLGFAAPALSSIDVGNADGTPLVLGAYIGAPNSITYENLAQSSDVTRGVGTALNCGYVSDFVYTDPVGGNHNLNVQWYAHNNGTNNIGCPTFGINKILQGGDPYYRAALSDGGNFFPASIQVTDSHGNVVYPGPEDPNGNGAVGTGRGYPIQIGGPDGSELTSSSIPGLGAPYTIAYEVVPLNYQFTFYLTYQSQPASCGSGRNVTVSSGGTTATVPQSVTLPNGQQYTFGYDATFGFINHITYPTGATVDYTWSYIPQSQPVSYSIDYGPNGGGGAGCSYRHDWMAITKRVVKMGGIPISEQDFQYQTNWSGTAYLWTSKTTEVFTKDFTRAGTPVVETIYTYLPEPVSHRIRPQGIANPETIALESTIQYYGTSGPAIRTVTKTWYPGSAQQVLGECVTDAGGTSGKFYQYNLDLKTDVAEFDYGQNVTSTCLRPSSPAPRRETVTVFHAFAATPIFPAGPSIMDRPDSVKVYGDGTLVGETDYTYDESSVAPASALNHDEVNYGPGSTVPRGNATTITRQCFTSGCTPTVTHYGYDETGQLISTTDAKGNPPTTYSYADAYVSSDGSPSGSTNTYVSKITMPPTNGVAHVESFTYGFTDGKMRSSTDENGNTTTYCYLLSGCTGSPDPWARETEVMYPDGGHSTVFYTDTGTNPYWITSTAINTGTNKTTKTITDALGHVIQTQITSDPAGTDYVDTTYDGLGLVHATSNPYRSTSESTYGLTTYTYDALGRTILQVEPDASTQSSVYTGNVTDSYDEAGRHTQRTNDGLGRLMKVLEPNSSNVPTLETDYQYDALDNLKQVDQWGGPSGSPGDRLRTFIYNSLGQLTSATNPESGNRTYVYDPNGNVLSMMDSRGIKTSYVYDLLNRLTTKSYSDGATGTAHFIFDVQPQAGLQLTNLIGRMSAAYTDSTLTGVSLFGYDAMGRVTVNTQCTPANCGTGTFPMNYGYDLAGDMTSYLNGAGVTLTQTFDSVGRATQLISNLSGPQFPATLASVNPINGYSAAGALRSVTLGNGVTNTWAYNQRLQPCRVNSNSVGVGLINCNDGTPTGNLQDISYGWNPGADNGNLASMASVGTQHFNRSYNYDAENRLLSMTAPGDSCSGLTWSYDGWGNRTDQTVTGGSCWQFHQLLNTQNRMTTAPYAYDANGNVIADGNHTYSYDAENRVTQVDGGATASYIYDGLGRRVRKLTGTAWRDYVYDLNGQVITEFTYTTAICWTATHLYFDGNLVAEYRNATTHFVSTDSLGSTRLVTAVNGSLFDSMDYLPFGEQIAGGTGSSDKFTGKERDAETGNDNFGARYYGSTMGRFMSPDWSAQAEPVPYSKLDDPQTLNLYSYVRNNPLSRVDKDGHQLTPIEVKDSQGNVRITYIDTRLIGRLQSFVNTADQQGVTFTFNNVFRSENEQNTLSTNYTHNKNGTSPHEAGVAFDINVKTSLKGTDLKGLTKIAGEDGSSFSPLANQAADPPHFQANDLITRSADGKVDQKYKDLIKENQKSYQRLEQQRKADPQGFDKKVVEIQ